MVNTTRENLLRALVVMLGMAGLAGCQRQDAAMASGEPSMVAAEERRAAAVDASVPQSTGHASIYTTSRPAQVPPNDPSLPSARDALQWDAAAADANAPS